MIKTPEQVERIRASCHLLARIFDEVTALIAPGITTSALDAFAEEKIRNAGADPIFKGYHGFPASICASRNEVVVHGIPDSAALREGDIVGIDMGLRLNGAVGDMAATFPVGGIDSESERLIRVTRESLEKAIAIVRAGAQLGDIGSMVQSHVETAGFGIVKQFVGHGTGLALHEEPQIPNYGKQGTGMELAAGMVLAIEPMVTAGNPSVVILDDGWTAATKDSSRAAHFEHTVLVTERGCEVLTRV